MNKKTPSYSSLDDVYASVDLSQSLPKTHFPQQESHPRHVFDAVRDELILAIEISSKTFFPDFTQIGTLVVFVAFILSYMGGGSLSYPRQRNEKSGP